MYKSLTTREFCNVVGGCPAYRVEFSVVGCVGVVGVAAYQPEQTPESYLLLKGLRGLTQGTVAHRV